MNQPAPVPPPPDNDDDDFADDADEQQNMQLGSNGFGRVAWLMYPMLAAIFLVAASIPFLIIYTVIWMTREASSMAP